MAIRKKRALTPQQRIAAANERTGTALFVFEQAATELEAASNQHFVAADELREQINALYQQADALDVLVDKAEADGRTTEVQAEKIRALVA